MNTSRLLKRTGALLMTLLVLMALVTPCLADKARDASDSVVMIYEQFTTTDSEGNLVTAAALGSGFAIGEVGKPVQYVVTNLHVVQDAYETDGIVQVYFSAAANKYVQAEIYWRSDEDTDLAILRLPEPTTERKALVLCPMNKIDIDDDFAALGYPAAAMNGNDFPKYDITDISVTRGGISKITRVAETDCYLLDLEISEGNSGGPLVNSRGEVVGVNSFYIKSQASNGSVTVKANYAVAIDELINSINRNVIPITVAGEGNSLTLWILVIAGALLLVLAAVFITLTVRKRKTAPVAASPATPVAAVPAQAMPVTLPASSLPAAITITVTLTALSGHLQGQEFSVDKAFRIGRDAAKCQAVFPVDHPGISGTHCQLAIDGNTVVLQDLGSSFGTFLADGTQILTGTPVRLSDGDRFYLAQPSNMFVVRIR